MGINPLPHFLRLIFIFNFCLSVSFIAHAQKFDQAYLKWKSEQESQDARLSQSDQYYLSRPSVSTSQPSSGIGAYGNQSKIKLNSANATELQQLNGIGEKKALAIIEYREKKGKFSRIEDLTNVKGIGPKMIEKNRARLGL